MQIKKLEENVGNYPTVFRNFIPPGLPSMRKIDHAIDIEEGGNPPNTPIFNLSREELLEVKEYVVELLQNGKLRCIKSPFGASLFLVEEKERLRAVVDYGCLNRI